MIFVNRDFRLQLSGFSTPHDDSDSADRLIAATVVILAQRPRDTDFVSVKMGIYHDW